MTQEPPDDRPKRTLEGSEDQRKSGQNSTNKEPDRRAKEVGTQKEPDAKSEAEFVHGGSHRISEPRPEILGRIHPAASDRPDARQVIIATRREHAFLLTDGPDAPAPGGNARTVGAFPIHGYSRTTVDGDGDEEDATVIAIAAATNNYEETQRQGEGRNAGEELGGEEEDVVLPGFTLSGEEEAVALPRRRDGPTTHGSEVLRRMIRNAPLVPSESVERAREKEKEGGECCNFKCFRMFWAKHKCVLVSVVSLLVIVAIVAPVALKVHQNQLESDIRVTVVPDANSTTTAVPTSQTTAAPTPLFKSERFQKLEKALGNVSKSLAFADPLSPQFLALHWLSDVDEANVPVNDTNWLVQRFVLAVFFHATGGDVFWLDRYGFLSESHECDWKGIFCNIHGEVEEISMNGNNITGHLPEEVVQLSHLSKLDLYRNRLEGTIPDVLGDMEDLLMLELGDNVLNGTIPPFLFFNVQDLLSIGLSDNKLTGPFPELGPLTNLRWINVGNNQLTSSLPQSINNLVALRSFFAYSNLLTGSLPFLPGYLDHLDLLSLNENFLSGSLPSTLGTIEAVSTLVLGENLFSGSIPDEYFASLSKLETLALYRNSLTGSIPESIFSVPTLKVLGLGHNKFNGSIPTLNIAKGLLGLGLEANNLTGTIPSGVASPSLIGLDLHSNRLTGTIPEELGSSTGLKALEFANNLLTGVVPESFERLNQLLWLSVARNKLGGSLNHICSIRSQSIRLFSADCALPDPEVTCDPDCCLHCCSDVVGECDLYFPYEAYLKKCMAQSVGVLDGTCDVMTDFIWY